MTELDPTRPLTTLRTLAAIGVLAFTLAGCSTAAPADTTEPTDTSTSEETETDSAVEEEAEDGEVVIIGEDLPSGTVALLAKVYAEGRDPQPTVEFLDATTVRFTFPEGISESDAISNCQIAWSAMEAEGVQIYFAVGDEEADCNALIEG